MKSNQYEKFLKYVYENGREKRDRTGTGTKSVFGYQMRFNLQEGFPLVTTKKVHLKSVIYELLWFLSGNTNVKFLQDHGVRIWNEWADSEGNLGEVYGAQWRRFGAKGTRAKIIDVEGNEHSGTVIEGSEIDQISNVIEEIKTNSQSRRLIVCAWNPLQLNFMALPPCHCFFQFYVCDGRLSCQLYQRSADVFLGVPFNIASYSLLTHMVAQQSDLEVGDFVWTGGDCHLYLNHLEQAKEQLSRTPFDYPKLIINRKPKDIFSYWFEDFEISNYQCHPTIKAPISV